MADDFYGTGTKYYGKDEIRPDGSFMATKWIVVAYIPIVPLGYFYVRSVRSETGIVSNTLPPITKRMGWKKRHIINVYAFIGVIAIAIFTAHYRVNTPFTPAAIPTSIGKGKALPPDQTNPKYKRSANAENGSPFPETSGYINGYEQLLNQGGSAISIDNSHNNSDLYAKLYSLDGDLSTPARVFFVQAGSSFTVDYLDFGNYELRYRDLDTGGIAKTESLLLEKQVKDGQEYFGAINLTLSSVINGNLETESISEEAF